MPFIKLFLNLGLFISYFLFVNCKTANTTKVNIINYCKPLLDKDGVNEIKLQSTLNSEIKNVFKDLVDTIYFSILDTTFGKVNKIINSGVNEYWMLDNGKLFFVQKNQVTKPIKLGVGPDQVSSIVDFEVDSIGKLIYCVDQTHRYIIVYDYLGNLVSKINFKKANPNILSFTKLLRINHYLYCYIPDVLNDIRNDMSFIQINVTNNDISMFQKYNYKFGTDYSLNFMNLVNSNQKLLKSEYFNSNIEFLDTMDMAFKSYIKIDMGEYHKTHFDELKRKMSTGISANQFQNESFKYLSYISKMIESKSHRLVKINTPGSENSIKFNLLIQDCFTEKFVNFDLTKVNKILNLGLMDVNFISASDNAFVALLTEDEIDAIKKSLKFYRLNARAHSQESFQYDTLNNKYMNLNQLLDNFDDKKKSILFFVKFIKFD